MHCLAKLIARTLGLLVINHNCVLGHWRWQKSIAALKIGSSLTSRDRN